MDSIENIAIIGLSGRFPKAKNIEQFWQNLRNGLEAITIYSNEELKDQGIPDALLNNPNYVKSEFFLEDADMFDASFFGISPKEAALIDPQQRLFLETAWEALENAGYCSENYPGLIGVFAGSGINRYIIYLNSKYNEYDELVKFQEMICNDKDYLATRVSYKLNLKGPSLTIQTACSTSLVAVHLACQSLLTYQCDIALAGGVYINLPQKRGYIYQEGTIFSSDGHCRAFDANASGTVLGQGVGIVVLKRLSDALEDCDTIHAVIKGSAINNDGALKVGYTAPSVEGQAEVIIAAQSMAQVNPETITYIETHGTGTRLGDPIEIAALTKAFRLSTQKKGYCAIGSVKTNIGHLDAAAGIAGLIKTVLALKHKQIPPSLNFNKPNPEIDFENSPFFVNTELREWNTDGNPRLAGVSSFGIGGTNAHVILEEAPEIESSSRSRPWQILLLSAKTANALEKMTYNLSQYLEQKTEINLADVAYTLQVGRRFFNHRRMVLCQDKIDAVNSLKTLPTDRVKTIYQEPMHREVVFMFSGQSSQYVNMGLDLYKTEPMFREEIDRCSEILISSLGFELREVIYPQAQNAHEANEKLKQTFITQPALFIFEYALAKLWISWGIHPQAMIGHSIGEYVAACLSGVLNLEDALSLVVARGRLMQSLPPGSMLAIFLTEEEVQPFLNEKLSLAVINGPSLCVVSGEKEAIEALREELSSRKLNSSHLHTSHAFHSYMMEPILMLFSEEVGKVKLNPPQIPFISNLTGKWITHEEATSPNYWVRHLRATVRFSDGIGELLKREGNVFLEVGPGNTLCTLVKQHQDKLKNHIILYSIPHPKERTSDMEQILSTLGNIWLAGVQIDWKGFYKGERRYRIPLPTYPFERKRYWIDLEQKEFSDAYTFAKLPGKFKKRSSTNQNLLEERGKNITPNGAAKDNIRQILAEIWRDVLGIEKLKNDDNFFDLGGHSLIAVRLFSRIENTFGKKLPLSTLFQAPTINQLASLIEDSEYKPKWDPLVPIQLKGNRVPFFCVHSEGGNVLEYQKLSDYLGENQPFYALQARGLEGEKVEKLSIQDMAALYISEIKKVQRTGPYFLGGYCLGGLVAFEMARQLEMAGEEIGSLIMISTSTPEHLRSYIPDMSIWKRNFYRFIERCEVEINNLSVLPWKKKIDYIKDRLSRVRLSINLKLEHFKGNICQKILRKPFKYSRPYILEKVRAFQNEAYLRYEPTPIKSPIVLFRTSRRPRYLIKDPTLGWENLTTGDLQIYEVKAFHKNILKDPQVRNLASKFKQFINIPVA